MTGIYPAAVAKESEHSHQRAYFLWVNVAHHWGIEIADDWSLNGTKLPKLPDIPRLPGLNWIHAIPNGGSRGDSELSRKIRGNQLKSEGVKEGISDVFIPIPVFGVGGLMKMSHGAYVEFKKPSIKPKRPSSKGGLSQAQIQFLTYADSVGYTVFVAYSWEESVNFTKWYLKSWLLNGK